MPLILSGGLNPDNVAEAIAAVRPFAVDIASGVERAPGRKDPEKLRAFARRGRRDRASRRALERRDERRSSTASAPTAASTSPRR